MKVLKIRKYNEIGEVEYKKNSRAKNLSIRINGEGRVRVTVPRGCNVHKAERFFLSKRIWVLEKLLQIERNKKDFLALVPGERIELFKDQIILGDRDVEKPSLEFAGEDFFINLPLSNGYPQDETRDEVMELVKQAGLISAKRHLPTFLDDLAEQYAMPFEKVTIRRMRTRWGSCSAANNISLNSGLVFLEEKLIAYVLLHELVHTVHKNHSPVFWNALGQILPDYPLRRKMLRSKSIIA